MVEKEEEEKEDEDECEERKTQMSSRNKIEKSELSECARDGENEGRERESAQLNTHFAYERKE